MKGNQHLVFDPRTCVCKKSDNPALILLDVILQSGKYRRQEVEDRFYPIVCKLADYCDQREGEENGKSMAHE